MNGESGRNAEGTGRKHSYSVPNVRTGWLFREEGS
jgi:hypothetical protein